MLIQPLPSPCRYALYYMPPAASALAVAGNAWLGRDAVSGLAVAHPALPGLPPDTLRRHTATARRYGFHATLKAPFVLAAGFDESHLMQMATSFSACQAPLVPLMLKTCLLDDFLALCPAAPTSHVAALAMRCMVYFDLLRASSDAETDAMARGRRRGTPNAGSAFRFHMTLSDRLVDSDATLIEPLQRAADLHFAQALSSPLTVDALTIFKQPAPDASWTVLARWPLTGSDCADQQPAPGRLFYVVGPSGVGKDALLDWLKKRLAERHAKDHASVVFARRTITRPPHPSEAHEPVDVDQFQHALHAGQFALHWQANGTCYGIRRGIEADLAAGRDVVINGSREHVPQVRTTFQQAMIVWIGADPATVGQRLAGRQRESGEALQKRLARGSSFTPPDDPRILHLDNSGPLEVAGARLLALFVDD